MANGFSLKVELSGLLHYVENEDRGRDIPLCIVLPEAPDHYAVVRSTRGGRLVQRGKPVAFQEFGLRKLVFVLTWAEPRDRAQVDFDFEKAVMAGDVMGAVPLEAMIGDRADQNPAIVGEEDLEASHVKAQILIPRAAVFSLPGGTNPSIRLSDQVVRDMAPFLNLQLDGLASARLALLPLQAGEGYGIDFLDLEPDEDGLLTLSISHFCPPTNHPERIDNDFRFHYALLKPLGGREGLLAQEELPVPIIERFLDGLPELALGLEEAATGEEPSTKKIPFDLKSFFKDLNDVHHFDLRIRGCNCSPARGLKRIFDLDAVANSIGGRPV